jgi:hypothetical protein
MTTTTSTPDDTAVDPAVDTTVDPAGVDRAGTIDTYLDAYGEPDAARRMQLIGRVWADDGRLLDPPLDGQGHAGISALTDLVHAHYPGHTFRRTTAVDAHHDVARYGWELVAPDGAVAVSGLDVAEFGGDGRIIRVLGFFGELQPQQA